jgi:hypothetical protein
VTPEHRLGQIATALEAVGLECLVMGGHAVRYYGVERNTIGFDFCVAAPAADDVRAAVARLAIPGDPDPREGPSWRPDDFLRFEIGRLPDGREEWLEFWLHNHLLPDFAELSARQERGRYGDREIGFLSLSDLLRSKETERESDWLDIALLEEIQDARRLAKAATATERPAILSRLRSRRGFERALQLGLLADRDLIDQAVLLCGHPVSFAYVLPYAIDVQPSAASIAAIDEAFLSALRKVEAGSPKHLALVEVVRRACKRQAMEIDRRDKESRRRLS